MVCRDQVFNYKIPLALSPLNYSALIAFRSDDEQTGQSQCQPAQSPVKLSNSDTSVGKEPEIHEQKVKPEERILTNKALAVMEEESRNNESKKNMPLENNGIDEEKEEEQEKQNNLRKEDNPLEKELKELKGDHEKQHRSKDMVQRTNGIHPPYERSVSAGGSFFQGILQEADQLSPSPQRLLLQPC